MKKGALFDMDGTLIDTERVYRHCWQKGIEDQGYVFDPAFLKDIAGTSGAYSREVINRYYPDMDAEALRLQVRSWVNEAVKTHIPEKKGAQELLHFLKENGVKIALATSGTHDRINAFLKGSHLENVFDAIISGQDLEKSKPDPCIFLKAAGEIGVAPEDCYVFEDGLNGVRAGAAAGCCTVMIPDFIQPTEAGRALCAGVYESVEAVLAAIKEGKL